MAGLIVRLLSYVLVVGALRTFLRRYRARLLLALKVAVVLWAVMLVARFLMFDHPPEQWLALAITLGAMGLLWGGAWALARAVERRR